MKILNPTPYALAFAQGRQAGRQAGPTPYALAFACAITAVFAPMSGAQDEADPLEEVVVYGIRSSLQAAADAKRSDARIMDAVVAEDIGKLPDNNIAEALQRVTGVSINRDFGVGSEVSIRGLPQNRVELNGRTTLGDGRNGIDFQDFPSSFLSAVEVIKSPTPEMIEGALGGTISLKTRRPLDLKDRLLSATAEYEYADKTENWAPIVNLFGGDNWDLGAAGQFGVIGKISYQDRSLRQDTYQASLFVFEAEDIDGISEAAKNTPSGRYVVPVEPKYEPWVEDRERTAYDLSAQWAPANGKGSFYLDLNFTERDGGEEAYSILSVSGNPVATADTYEDGNGALNNYRLEEAHLAIPKTWSEFRATETFSHAFGGEWSFTDQITVSGEYATAESETSHPKSELNWRAIDPTLEEANPGDINQRYTDVTIVNSSGKPPSVMYDDGEVFTQEQYLAFREFRHITNDIDNSEDAWRLDLEWTDPISGWNWLTNLKGGIRTTEREYERNRDEERIRDIHRNLTTNDEPDIIWMSDFKAMHPGTIITPSVGKDIFDHTGTVGTNQLTPFTVYDAKLLRNADATYRRVQQLLEGTNFATEGSLQDNLERVYSSYAKLEEETLAWYVQANLDFERIRVVLGTRYVETDITSSAYEVQPVPDMEGETQQVLVSLDNSYDEFLPSLNATVDLTDDTLMRFSAAKVMRRPDFGQLSPASQYNSDRVSATQGSPSLDPYRATQFDLAFEHYFGGHNLVSATLFFKNVESFLKSSIYCADAPDAVIAVQNDTIVDQVCIRPTADGDSSNYIYAETQEEFDAYEAAGRKGVLTTTQDNGSSGTVEGYELGLVYTFDMLPEPWSGLGINANYTKAKSEDPDGVPLLDISETSYNAQLFWEYGDFSARLAYTWRDGFLDENAQKRVERVGVRVENRTGDDPTEGNDYRDDVKQLDFAANWDITENFSAHLFVYNITAEPLINMSATGTTWQIRETDRRFTLGFRARF